MQAVPCFLESIEQGRNVPCIIPCGIDQDPHFRITRDIAPLLGFFKPALLHCKLLPSLQGFGAKMSSSQPETVIFAADNEKEARRKIGNALTGGKATVEEQRRLGANPDICVAYANYQYIFESDEDHLKVIHDTCRSGARLCGECKAELADKVVAFLEKHQERREKARDRVEEFMLRD
jgi:tryptophanyl-tRNA synthetase